MAKFTGDGRSLGDSVVSEVNGYVGINTINPSRRLDIVGTHATSTFRVFYDGSDVPEAGTASINIWASEPGQTFVGSGIGANVNGHPYYGRVDTTRGQSYIRFIDGITSFHNNTGDAIGLRGIVTGKQIGRAHV